MPASSIPSHLRAVPTSAVVPRSIGKAVLSSKVLRGQSVIDDFRCSGALRVLFPRSRTDLPAILINTSGGLTSGDTFDFEATAGQNTTLTLSTQAAERGYCAITGPASTQTRLNVNANATLNWLPQELILFDGFNIERTLRADLAASARFLFVELVVFGRTAMGEAIQTGRFRDRVSIYRDSQPLYLDRVRLDGEITQMLGQQAIGQNARAMASLIYVAPDAEGHLDNIRAHLPDTAGASLISNDTIALRMLAADSFEMRRVLLPILDILSQDKLPKTWRL